MSLESYERSFLRIPYRNANYSNGGRRRRMRGGRMNRFGGPLSGNPNLRVFRGSPSGGAIGRRSKYRDPYMLGGRRCYHRGRGPLMDNYINPRTTYHTYPMVGTTIY